MKKFIILSVFSFVFFIAHAFDNAKIENEIRDEVKLHHFSKSRVILETGFGAADLYDESTIEELTGKEILKVNLIYTVFKEVDKFDQVNLNDVRWSNLEKLLGSSLLNDVPLRQIGVSQCVDKDCAKDQFHGFIIEYKRAQLNYVNIPIQKTVIQSEKISTVEGKSGTMVQIPKNAFEDVLGNDVIGPIDFKLREALTPEDIVMGNLLTITNKNEALESDGMVQLTAFQNGKQLVLKEGKELVVSIPKSENLPDMKVWRGQWVDGQLKWLDPRDLKDGSVDTLVELSSDIEESLDVSEVETQETIEMLVGFDFTAKGGMSIDYGEIRSDGLPLVSVDWVLENGALKEITLTQSNSQELKFSSEDYTYDIGKEKKLSDYQAIKIQRWFDSKKQPQDIPFKFWGWKRVTNARANKRAAIVQRIGSVSESVGFNAFRTDRNTFNISNLGWANIDRLASFPNSKIAKLEIMCDNDADIENVLITLVVPKRKLYLPGYEMASGNYCFAHNDAETNYKLPVGDIAVVVLTGTKDGKYYSVVKSIKLGNKDIEKTHFTKSSKKSTLEQIKKAI